MSYKMTKEEREAFLSDVRYGVLSGEEVIMPIQPCDFERDMRPIARRYLGEEKGDHYTEAVKAIEEMVTIRMRPERLSSADYSKE